MCSRGDMKGNEIYCNCFILAKVYYTIIITTNKKEKNVLERKK